MKMLLTNQDSNTDGSQDTQTLENSLLFGTGLTVIAWGTWNGATVSFEVSPDGGTTWIAYSTSTNFTANGIQKAEINPDLNVKVRGSVTSVGESTDVNLAIL